MSNWEIIKKKQAENIAKLYEKRPDDFFLKAEMEKPESERVLFAPKNGICYHCKKNIAEGAKAITLESLGNYVITGCPYCHHSYCD